MPEASPRIIVILTSVGTALQPEGRDLEDAGAGSNWEVAYSGLAEDPSHEVYELLKHCAHAFILTDESSFAKALDLIKGLNEDAAIDAPVGMLTLGQFTFDSLAVLLVAGVRPIHEVPGTGAEARERIADYIKRALDCLPRPVRRTSGDGYFEIGSVMHGIAADPVAYERGRTVSLVSASMQAFLNDLSDAVRGMGVPAGRPPWDPDAVPGSWAPSDDPPQNRRARPALATPGLDDLYTHHLHPQAREFFERAGDGTVLRPQSVLIRGESGTGKSLVTSMIRRILDEMADFDHVLPRVDVNCAGMTAENFDHEMFGAPPNVWTGIGTSVGALARAAYGTVFLDEIGDMSWDGQARLLRFLDDGQIRPNFIRPFQGHARVIAATNRNLEHMIQRREFKHDLLARFGVQVTIPPLRNRDADERTRLVDFVAQNPRFNPCLECDGRDAACPHPRSVTHIDAEAMKHLVQSWDFRQGNFRELELTIHQGMRSARQRGSRLLQIDDLPRITDSYLGGVEDSPVSGQSEVPAAWAQVRLESRADLERIARKARAPLVDEGGGTLSLLTRGARYWCQVSEDERQLNP